MVTTTVDLAANTHTGSGVLSLRGGETVVHKRSRLGRGCKWAVRQIVLSTVSWNKQRKIKLWHTQMLLNFSELNIYRIMIHES